jgi:hypothetical protein
MMGRLKANRMQPVGTGAMVGRANIMPAAKNMGGGDTLRLYQILPPPLVERAKIWGNKLALKDNTVCLDMPYFSAPGMITCVRPSLCVLLHVGAAQAGHMSLHLWPGCACLPASVKHHPR